MAFISRLMALSSFLISLLRSDLRTPSAEYEQHKAEYSKAQEQLVGKIVDVAKSYIPLFHIYSSIIAQLDVLLAFAEASANAPIPYTRPDILSIDKNNSTVIYDYQE